MTSATVPARSGVTARLAAACFGTAVAIADLTPPRIRYGYVHPLAGRLLRHPLAAVPAVDGVTFRVAGSAADVPAATLRCGLLADELDVGGVGRVVEMLAEGLRSAAIEPVVVCPADGGRTARLRTLGVEVLVAPDARTASQVLRAARLDVLELHSAPRHLADAALRGGAPLVPVLHNTEIHYDTAAWRDTATLFRRSAAVIAVSDVVRRFHIERLPRDAAERIVVVANGSMPVPPVSDETRASARAALAGALGVELADDVVVCCLARYDSQKNIAGTVTSFLRVASLDPHVRLVVAGDPSDWLEHARADAIRRTQPEGDRVHLLGSSDAAAVLVASDVFVLDSFFEGWPLAATEAVAVGLPVVLSETGGAAELVARAAPGSFLVANPTGPADRVTDRRARATRRRATRQRNAGQLADALAAAARTVRQDGRSRSRGGDTFGPMVAGHADVVRAAASDASRPAGPGAPLRTVREG